MSRFTLLRGARQLLTLAGPEGARSGSALQCLSVIPDGSVLVDDEGTVVEVGSTRRLENLKEARSALEIDAHGSVVMPGFIDPSLRVALNAAGGGARRPKPIGHFFQETLELLRSCVLNGTVSAELKGTAALQDYRSDFSVLRRLAKIGNNPAGTVRCWQLEALPQSDVERAAFSEILQRLARKLLVQFIELPLDDTIKISDDLLHGIQAAGVGVKLLWSGSSASALGQALRNLHPFAVFCLKPLTHDELVAMTGYTGAVVFAPGREVGDAGLSGARSAIDAGLCVALSSGYDAVSYPAYSMQMAVSLANVYGRLTLEEAINAATINAAHAIGCGQTHGCLMKGRRADLLVLNLPDYREIPRQFGINHVRMVMRDGDVIMNRGGWKMGTHETSQPDRVRAQRVGGA